MTNTERVSTEATTSPDDPRLDANDDNPRPDGGDEGVSLTHNAAESAVEENHLEQAIKKISVSVRGLVYGAIIVALVLLAGVLGWLYWDGQQQLYAQARKSDNISHAEKIALDYAANAAAMNFENLDAWKQKLVAGTTPELKDKLTKAGTSMEQILVPLQWNSTASPLGAKVRSNNGNIYIVDAFVSVMTKTMQSPDPLQSTAAYAITIDSSKEWQISDVGGIGAMVAGK